MNENNYTVVIYDSASKTNVTVEASKEVYDCYRRTAWNIKDNNRAFFAHEIQMSSLIGGADGSYENFHEFVSEDGNPEFIVSDQNEIEQLWEALYLLKEDEYAVIHALYFQKMTIREYEQSAGLARSTIWNIRNRAIKKMKKYLDF